MHQRPSTKFLPAIEQFEAKQLLSAGPLAEHAAAVSSHAPSLAADADKPQHRLPTHFVLARVTNTPYQTPYPLVPPFQQQVLVQHHQPVAGQVYNVLDVVVKNWTSQTFTAKNNFKVKVTGGHWFPVLTGNEQWKPKQIFIFYILTKKYYPLPEVAGGFIFNLGGTVTTAIPGPSGNFLRLTYKPATFPTTLNWIVAYGQGNETGVGSLYGLPNTSINIILAAAVDRGDIAGHF